MTDVPRRRRVGQLTTTVVAVSVALLSLAALPPLASAFAVLGATTLFGVAAYRLQNHLLAVLSAAFVVRLALAVTDTVFGVLPTPGIVRIRNEDAIQLLTQWSRGEFPLFAPFLSRNELISHLLAPFYLFFGRTPLSGRIAIAFFSIVCGYLVFRLGTHLANRRTAVAATGVVLFWPTVLVRSVLVQREILILAASLLFLLAVLELSRELTLPWLVALLVGTHGTFLLRRENLLIVGAVVGAVGLMKSRDRPVLLGAIGVLSTGFLTFFALNLELFIGPFRSFSPDVISKFAHERARGSAAYLVELHYETWLDIVLYAPVKLLYYLYTPFPWQISSVVELVVGITALCLLAATVAAKWGTVQLREKPEIVTALLTYFFTGVLSYSIIEMNYGAAIRRRILFVPILLLLAVVGLSRIDVEIRLPTR